jgi:protein-tyrosine kinase
MSSVVERLGKTGGTSEPVAARSRSIGLLMLEAGKLTTEGAERALRHTKEKGIRFGEACVQLNLVTGADIERALSTQYDYPYVQPGETSLSQELIAAYRPFSPQVEALRALRTQLLLRWFSSERRILAIVSPRARDGRTFVAANLAVVFAQLGERTLLIDADLRRPRQHELFNVSNQYGLSSALSARPEGAAVEKVKGFADLSIVTAGAIAPNPLELLSREDFKLLLASKAADFDVILIDTSAAADCADAQTIGARAGGTLMVVREGQTRVRDLERLAGSIRRSNTEIVGAVQNRY